MKLITWDKEKNKKLKKNRNISFEVVSYLNETKEIIDIIKHPQKDKYPNQQILVVLYKKYIYLVPFVEEENYVFLKTIIPSRKATKKYLGGEKDG